MKLLAEHIIHPELAFHYAYTKSIKVPPHHHDFFEFFITFDNQVEHRVNGTKQMLESGSLVLIRPADEHSFEQEDAPVVHLMNVAFRQDTFEAIHLFLEFPAFIQSMLNDALPPVIHLQKVEQQWLKSQFEELAFSTETNKAMIKHRFKMQLIHLFVHFFQRYEHTSESSIPPWLIELRTQMQQKEHFLGGLSRLIELSGKSQEHVNRSMKKYYGMTTTEWLNTIKVQYAANLLLYSELDILAVSLDSGFENLSHFYSLFQRHFHLSPAKYRKANKKVII